MPVFSIAGWILVLLTAAGRPAPEDQRAVREQAARYETALLRANKAVLEGIFHKDHHLVAGPSVRGEVGRSEAIGYYTDPARRFHALKTEVGSIRLFGDTAIETGSLSAELKEYGVSSVWRDLTYMRVWIREGKSWQLVHEQY
jgi:ketosteroid isomerase-like protein